MRGWRGGDGRREKEEESGWKREEDRLSVWLTEWVEFWVKWSGF